ncbi:L-seryl-tRNA(Sec) kinase-like isoform X1 [Anopheles stephensi]|uniref:L-seryl-tRNA(Sec) kinase-like isoform X1 n=1 Tax=Anopheles stephensi TaxID=30069 RepID=UPI00165874D5|nr:L-seryl-tRNA(Sec) kinase-like isoform X1 [Anopheles stephensi]
MTRVCLNVLLGIPGSGKTTYCQQLAVLPSRSFEVVHVCYDCFIKIDENYDKFRDASGLYKLHRHKLLSHVERIILHMKRNDQPKLQEVLARWSDEFGHELNISTQTMASDVVFLIDDNNYYRSMRTEWQKIARKLSIGYFETFFDPALSIAVQRNRARAQPIAEEVINHMWMRLEKPSGKLYDHELEVLRIQQNVDYDGIVQQIQYCFENPLKPPTAQPAVQPMKQSTVHKIDIILRKLISKKIGEARESMVSSQQLQSYVKVLQERKKFVLEQIRKCELNVSEEMMYRYVEELF